MVARDRALLWVLFDTGITVTELCVLRVADLNQQTGLRRVRGKGGKERQMSLGATCLSHLRLYLRQMDPATRSGLARRQAGGDPLFGSKGKQPLTKNGVTMVFARFRKRAGIGTTTITPQVLRHSFALRYLQTGGKMLKAKNAWHAKASICRKEAHLLSFLVLQVETIPMHAETWGVSFVSPYLMTIVL